ncbi:MAG: His/Gly/Thr/Pro-type tRNA ligase C-terminal domain-containing protein, partial [Desulfotomaculales bacterium]
PGKEALDVFLASGDGIPEEEVLKLLWSLRKEGVSADKDYLGRSLKAQMKFAGKAGARFVAILGQDELARGTVALKNMATGSQIEVPATNFAGEVRRLLFGEDKQEKH